jgi:phosphoglycerate dehydrogenase-like enzyme
MRRALDQTFDVVWGKNESMPAAQLEKSLETADILISSSPVINEQVLADAPRLHTVVEVAGAFPDTIDYAACEKRKIEVLSCSPGFQDSVAEMALAMALAGSRGLVTEHELFRNGNEHWLNDNAKTDFSLHGVNVGFIGYGAIARATHRLLKPFNVRVMAYDPWLSTEVASDSDITLCSLDQLLQSNRCVFVTAAPTRSNYQLINASRIEQLADASLLIVISRAHLIDFEAVVDAAQSGRIRVAIDVFPEEPLSASHRARNIKNMIFSPHRAAAVSGGRQLIGQMILHDLKAKHIGSPARQLQRPPQQLDEIAGIGDADQVGSIAVDRDG